MSSTPPTESSAPVANEGSVLSPSLQVTASVPGVQQSGRRAQLKTQAKWVWGWFLRAVGTSAGQSLAFVLVTAGAFFALMIGEGSDELYKKLEWAVWKLSAALAICAAIFAGLQGIGRNQQFDRHHSKATSEQLEKHRVVGLTVAALLFVSILLFVLIVGTASVDGNRGRVWPDGFIFRPLVVLGFSILAIVPWLMLVWRTHEASQSLRKELGPEDLGELSRLWGTVNHCVLTFAMFVVISLIPTGALRAVWLTKGEDVADQFPSTDVLLGGGFVAVALAAVALPLIASWRKTAGKLVDTTYPANDASMFDKDTAELRTALETHLGLNTGLLQSPLAAFSIFLPLVTTLLAAFIPELGK